jgi:quercetin dioxygenase-like cupin family protein
MSAESFSGVGILFALLVVVGATSATTNASPVRAVLPADDDAWRDGPPGFPGGSMFAVVSGDPTRAGPFMIRVELPSGYRLPPYRRARDESIIVLAGTIEVDTQTLSSGSFIRLRAEEHHSLSTQSGATLQIFGDGPLEMSRCAHPSISC